MNYVSLLRRMISVVSVSGCEKSAAKILIPLFEKLFDEAYVDPVGNIILRKYATNRRLPTVMLDAHIDEVGFRVKKIFDGGFLSLAPVGGIDALLLPASEVTIHGKEDLFGVFGVTPPHLAKPGDADKLPSIDSLFIDTGYEKETLERLVSIGDPVTYRGEIRELQKNRISGRAFDDKACAAAIVCAVLEVPRDKLAYNVAITLSSREEVGGGGAACAAARLKPDFAIVTDVNFARAPGVPENESAPIGEGPMISVSAVTDGGLTDKVISIAKSLGISVSPVVESSSTGTNATGVYIAGEGTPCAVISLPLAGMHGATETISLSDVKNFVALISEIISDSTVLSSISNSPENIGEIVPDPTAARGVELLKELCGYVAPSGREGTVARRIAEIVSPYADEINIHPDGSVIARIKGREKGGTALMLSAHMDEVGFMVKSVEDSGLLKMAKISVSDPKVLAGRRVVIDGIGGIINGYVGFAPVHMTKGKELPSYDDLYIDIGASSKEEAQAVCPPGSYGTFDSDFIRFGESGRSLKGRAIDDRLGCAVMCDIARRMKDENIRSSGDVYFAFTCREELGLSGAVTAARRIRPDLALVFESTAVADVLSSPETSKVAAQGEGGVLSILDRSSVYDADLTATLFELAKINGIPCQIKKFVSGGNDAGHIRRACGGTRCAALSAPSRYIHTASNVIRESDFLAIEELAWEFIKSL